MSSRSAVRVGLLLLVSLAATDASAEVVLSRDGKSVEVRATHRGVWSSARHDDPAVLNPSGDLLGDGAPSVLRGDGTAVAWLRPTTSEVLVGQVFGHEWQTEPRPAGTVMGPPVGALASGKVVIAWSTDAGEVLLSWDVDTEPLRLGPGAPQAVLPLGDLVGVVSFVPRPAPIPIITVRLDVVDVSGQGAFLWSSAEFGRVAASSVIDAAPVRCRAEDGAWVMWWVRQPGIVQWVTVDPTGAVGAVSEMRAPRSPMPLASLVLRQACSSGR